VEQVIIGSLLGDGSISSKHGRYQEVHSKKQEDYLLWKKKILDKEFSTKFSYRNPNGMPHIEIHGYEIFKDYYKMLYSNGKKNILPQEFLKKIDKLAIVIWYFDDGHYALGKNSIVLATNCFSYENQIKLQELLKEKFSLNFRIQTNRRNGKKEQYYLVNYGGDANKFLDFIKENVVYIPECFIHKMGHLDKRNTIKIENNRIKNIKYLKNYYLQNREKAIEYAKKRYELRRNMENPTIVFEDEEKGD